ncbi:MAG: hypothetical protein ACUVV4_07985 [Candidatus Bathyarchaeia archaeon]
MEERKSEFYRKWFLSKFQEMGVEPIPLEKPKIRFQRRRVKARS